MSAAEDQWPRWLAEDQAAACREGWDIFECGDVNHEPYELEKIDTPDDEDWVVLDDDMDAWRIVTEGAANGSPLHQRAIAFLACWSPGELVHIASNLGGQPDRCTCAWCRSPVS